MNPKRVQFPCGDITLEGEWHLPQGEGSFPAVIVCHPHPLYGGNMFNNIVLAVCEELSLQSVAAFRFNFRGVGRSGGDFGGGIGEQEDVKAALDFVSSAPAIDPKRIGLAGYSFGGGVVLPVALQNQRVGFLALVSPALPDAAWHQLKKYPGPAFIIIGDADSVIAFEKFQQNIKDATQYYVVSGADHFWVGFEEEVARRVARFFATGFTDTPLFLSPY